MITSLFIRGRQKEILPQKRKKQCNPRAEIEVVWPQAKECQQPLELEKLRNKFSPLASKGNVALLTAWFKSSDTDFRLLASRIVN